MDPPAQAGGMVAPSWEEYEEMGLDPRLAGPVVDAAPAKRRNSTVYDEASDKVFAISSDPKGYTSPGSRRKSVSSAKKVEKKIHKVAEKKVYKAFVFTDGEGAGVRVKRSQRGSVHTAHFDEQGKTHSKKYVGVEAGEGGVDIGKIKGVGSLFTTTYRRKAFMRRSGVYDDPSAVRL